MGFGVQGYFRGRENHPIPLNFHLFPIMVANLIAMWFICTFLKVRNWFWRGFFLHQIFKKSWHTRWFLFLRCSLWSVRCCRLSHVVHVGLSSGWKTKLKVLLRNFNLKQNLCKIGYTLWAICSDPLNSWTLPRGKFLYCFNASKRQIMTVWMNSCFQLQTGEPLVFFTRTERQFYHTWNIKL